MSTPLQRVRGGGAVGRGRPFPLLQQQIPTINRSYVGSTSARGGQRGSFVVRKRAPVTQAKYSTTPNQTEEAKRPRISTDSVSQPNAEKQPEVGGNSPLVEETGDDDHVVIHEEVLVEEDGTEEREGGRDTESPALERVVRADPIHRPRELTRGVMRSNGAARNTQNGYDRPSYPDYADYRHVRYPPEPRRKAFRRPFGRQPVGRDPYGRQPYANREMRMRREPPQYRYPYGPSTSRYDPYREGYRCASPMRRVPREDPYRRDYPPFDSYEDMETALENAWNCGFVDILEMGMVVYKAKLAGTFSERALQRFIDSRVQRMNFTLVHSESYAGMTRKHGIAENFAAFLEGNTLMNVIFIRWQKKIEPVTPVKDAQAHFPMPIPIHTPITSLFISPRFLSKIYRIKGDEVFREMNLTNLVAKWPVPGSTTQAAMTSMFRRILQHLCKFPPNIKKYTIRISTRGGSNGNLLEMPAHVRLALEELGLALLNMDHEELSDDYPSNYRNSRFFLELAETEDGREKAYNQLKNQRKEWVVLVPVLLRNAVRDVRLHTVTQKVENGKEIYLWRCTRKKKESQEGNGKAEEGGNDSSL